jgi:hypothetical protein
LKIEKKCVILSYILYNRRSIMSNFVIIPDTSCDLTRDLREKYNIPDYLHGALYYPDGRETLYCHCSSLLVSAGESVKAGDVIALVGQTGLATGPHLHFELHENGSAVNPDEILSGAVNVY